MAMEVGLKNAFLEFTADSAVLNHNGKIIKKKASDSQLYWQPDTTDCEHGMGTGICLSCQSRRYCLYL